jgi:hypothetical protein
MLIARIDPQRSRDPRYSESTPLPIFIGSGVPVHGACSVTKMALLETCLTYTLDRTDLIHQVRTTGAA